MYPCQDAFCCANFMYVQLALILLICLKTSFFGNLSKMPIGMEMVSDDRFGDFVTTRCNLVL
uniref:Uncharacterized protein n=1 Tax=Anguilla anguilla TaxID=7936 RepID=A0A0E9WC38_ANGAN